MFNYALQYLFCSLEDSFLFWISDIRTMTAPSEIRKMFCHCKTQVLTVYSDGFVKHVCFIKINYIFIEQPDWNFYERILIG